MNFTFKENVLIFTDAEIEKVMIEIASIGSYPLNNVVRAHGMRCGNERLALIRESLICRGELQPKNHYRPERMTPQERTRSNTASKRRSYLRNREAVIAAAMRINDRMKVLNADDPIVDHVQGPIRPGELGQVDTVWMRALAIQIDGMRSVSPTRPGHHRMAYGSKTLGEARAR